MSDIQDLLPSQRPARWYSPPNNLVQAPHPSTNDTGRIVFTRQLWQRTMPDEKQTEQGVLTKSHSGNAQAIQNNALGTRRSSSTFSLRSHRRSPSPSRGSKKPLTPEESPPSRTTRKRSAGIVEQEDKALASAETTPAHTRANSGESAVHVCICQPDPKIPRPRNGT